MTSRHPATTTTPTDNCLLRWVLQRGRDAVTCEITTPDPKRFSVQVRLAPSASPALMEQFDSPVAAMERHAMVAASLIDAGWVVTQHTARHVPIAA